MRKIFTFKTERVRRNVFGSMGHFTRSEVGKTMKYSLFKMLRRRLFIRRDVPKLTPEQDNKQGFLTKIKQLRFKI